MCRIHSGGVLLLMSASSTDIARIVSHRRRLLSGYKHYETTGGKDMYVFSVFKISTFIVFCAGRSKVATIMYQEGSYRTVIPLTHFIKKFIHLFNKCVKRPHKVKCGPSFL